MRSESLFKSSSPGGSARRWSMAAALSLAAHGMLLLPWQPAQQSAQTRTVAVKLGPPSKGATPPLSPPIPTMEPPAPTAPARRPGKKAKAMAMAEPTPHLITPANPDLIPTPPAIIAPAIDWRYLLLQDGRQGQARMIWRPDGAVYALRMERELGGRPLSGSRSEGLLSSQGLSPERFTQQRTRRAGQAARDSAATNFRQGENQDRISFSASAEQVPSPKGVQDRLSWWLQLAATVAAAPQQFLPGRDLRMMVVGLRGEAREWVFEVLANTEDLHLPAGPIRQALHLRRQALGPYDGEIDIWLDPARHHLPVRLVFNLPDGRGWELQLMDEGLPQP